LRYKKGYEKGGIGGEALQTACRASRKSFLELEGIFFHVDIFF